MLSQAENERLTQVGAGTPMGNLMRQYWIPVVLASELQPGGRAKRVNLAPFGRTFYVNKHNDVMTAGIARENPRIPHNRLG